MSNERPIRRYRQWLGWLPLVVLPLAAYAVRPCLADWAFMWTMLVAIVGGCKWLTWWRAVGETADPPLWRSFGYLILWPGMDAPAFLAPARRPPRPTARAWSSAALKTCFGAVLLWGVARLVAIEQPLVAGWIGMVGVAFVMHFGVLHLLALFWQSVGVDACQLFRAPARATSLGDFWGSRWNLAFRYLAYTLAFRPLARRLGMAGANLLTFLVSGLVHELVISLPAGAGYGLPTAYFVLQGLGVLIERSRAGKRLWLREGLRGWLFAFAFTVGPVYWLFHPPFVTRVVIPFMQAIGAL